METDPYFFTEEEKQEKKVKKKGDPRYVVSLQSETEDCRYKDFFETEKFADAKEKAEESVAKYGRVVIIYDRLVASIINRFEPEKGSTPMVAAVITPEMKRPPKLKRK